MSYKQLGAILILMANLMLRSQMKLTVSYYLYRQGPPYSGKSYHMEWMAQNYSSDITRVPTEMRHSQIED